MRLRNDEIIDRRASEKRHARVSQRRAHFPTAFGSCPCDPHVPGIHRIPSGLYVCADFTNVIEKFSRRNWRVERKTLEESLIELQQLKCSRSLVYKQPGHLAPSWREYLSRRSSGNWISQLFLEIKLFRFNRGFPKNFQLFVIQKMKRGSKASNF